HAVPRAVASRFVDEHDLAVPPHHDRHLGGVDHDVAVADLHCGVDGRLDRGLLRAALHRAADVEGAHRELRAGLTDRLCRDHAHGLADVHHGTPGEVAPVALCADAEAVLAGQ